MCQAFYHILRSIKTRFTQGWLFYTQGPFFCALGPLFCALVREEAIFAVCKRCANEGFACMCKEKRFLSLKNIYWILPCRKNSRKPLNFQHSKAGSPLIAFIVPAIFLFFMLLDFGGETTRRCILHCVRSCAPFPSFLILVHFLVGVYRCKGELGMRNSWISVMPEVYWYIQLVYHDCHVCTNDLWFS